MRFSILLLIIISVFATKAVASEDHRLSLRCEGDSRSEFRNLNIEFIWDENEIHLRAFKQNGPIQTTFPIIGKTNSVGTTDVLVALKNGTFGHFYFTLQNPIHVGMTISLIFREGTLLSGTEAAGFNDRPNNLSWRVLLESIYLCEVAAN